MMTTYAVHLPDGGTSEYVNFAFSCAIEFSGQIYLLRSDGLFVMGGESDAGAAIAANVGIGFDEAGTIDHLASVYVEADTDAAFSVVVPAKQGVFEYETRLEDNGVIHRATLGKGLRESKFYVFVRNTLGAAFTVMGVTLNRIKGSRRI